MWKYCENIVIPFLSSSFFPSFFILHTRTAFFSLFFSPPHTYPYTFLFLLLSTFYPYHFLQTLEHSSSLSLFYFFFSLSALRLEHPYNSSPWSTWFFSFSLNSTAYKRDDSDQEDWIRAEQTQSKQDQIRLRSACKNSSVLLERLFNFFSKPP